MKKFFCVLLTCLVLMISAGCATDTVKPAADNDLPIAAAVDAPVPAASASPEISGGITEVPAEDSKNTPAPSYDVVDIDLTIMSSTMVYAEVYNMMEVPEEYLGKVVKINGLYYSSFYDPTGKYYHFIIIEDAAACCQSGLEFVWTGEHEYPEDYPAEDTRVEVVGAFKSYDELGETYFYIEVNDIVVLEPV